MEEQNYTAVEQMADLQKKIALVEGDLHAYQEMTREKMETNRATILRLRRQNKELHKALAKRLEADANVIDQAFENAEVRIQKKMSGGVGDGEKRTLKSMRIRSADATERTALRNKSGEAANDKIDQALCDQKKRLNLLKSETTKKKNILKDLQTTYDQLVKEASFAVEMSKGESRSAQKLTSLENRLDIAKRKSAEAGHINKVYQMIHQYLEEESLSFHNQLDELEQQIKKSKIELEDIRRMHDDASVSRERARGELHKSEEIISMQRLEHEKRLAELREHHVQVQKEAKRQERNKNFVGGPSTQTDSVSGDGRSIPGDRMQSARSSRYNKSLAGSAGGHHSTLEDYDSSPHVIEQTTKIDELEAHFSKIKEVTGVSELAQVVGRFEAQARTHAELETKRLSNLEEKERLVSDLNEARNRLAELKYGGGGSDSTAQKYQLELEAAKEGLEAKKRDTNVLMYRANESKSLVSDLTRALQHLTEKLERVRMSKTEDRPRVTTIAPSERDTTEAESEPVATVEGYLDRCNNRIDVMLDTLPAGDELERVLERARTDDVYLAALETRMPTHNVRVPRMTAGEHDESAARRDVGGGRRAAQLGDDSSDGEADDGFMSRDQLKKKSGELIDSKSKKRAGKGRSTKRKRF